MISDAEFWKTVQDIDWGSVSKRKSYTYLQYLLALQWGKERSVAVREKFKSFQHQLNLVIETWENETGKTLDCSDDGLNDLVAHIIGLGETEFNSVMKNPLLAYERAQANAYTESFAYVFPYDNTLDELANLPKWRDEYLKSVGYLRDTFPEFEQVCADIESAIRAAGTDLTVTQGEMYLFHKAICHKVHLVLQKMVGTQTQLEDAAQATSPVVEYGWVNYCCAAVKWKLAQRDISLSQGKAVE